jgi:hypothetical protein
MIRFKCSSSPSTGHRARRYGGATVFGVAVLVVALVPAAAHAQGELSGPVYPAPGGSSVSFSGMIGGSAGMDIEYSGFDFTDLARLFWGPWDGSSVEVAFDGAVDSAGETLSFDPGSSNLAMGVARWQGTADLTFWNVSDWDTLAVPTRFTITATVGATPLPMTDGASVGEAASGALVQVTGAFDVNLLAEAYYGSSWIPVVDLFDSVNTPPGHQVITNLYDGFFFEALPFFADGFECGSCAQWSRSVGEVP